jgi:simple sugar transport system permease protein
MITRSKIGQNFAQLSSKQQNPIDSEGYISKVRITAITIPTIVAAWGQIILLQNTGFFSTYGFHMGIGVLAVSALVVGGATISKATVRNALLVIFCSLLCI